MLNGGSKSRAIESPMTTEIIIIDIQKPDISRFDARSLNVYSTSSEQSVVRDNVSQLSQLSLPNNTAVHQKESNVHFLSVIYSGIEIDFLNLDNAFWSNVK